MTSPLWLQPPSHGADCRCLSLDARDLGIGDDLIAHVLGVTEEVPPLTLRKIAQIDADTARRLSPSCRSELAGVFASIRDEPCGTEATAGAPSVPWRHWLKLGLDSIADRWPDDLEEWEWAALSRGGVNLNEPAPDEQKALQRLGALRPIHLLNIRRVALTPMAEPEPEPEPAFDGWSVEETMRVLQLSRSTIGGWLHPRAAVVLRTALVTGREPVEVLAFSQYLAKCDRGMGNPSEVVRSVLREFPGGNPAALDDHLAMIDDLRSTDGEDEDAEVLLDLVDPPLALEVPAAPLANDGGPDPLAVVNQLLPGGRGTRGQPPIVYTETLLEKQLLPYLRGTPPTLVVLSGNAGDGKTAFLESVLAGAGENPRSGKNEFEIALGLGRYLVVLDGSEDAEERSNDDLLVDALSSFAGDDSVEPDRGTIIAVNKGRLLQFLGAHRDDYGFLWDVVATAYLGLGTPRESPYLLLDLNNRSSFAPDAEASIFGHIARNFATWSAWSSSCVPCSAFEACPVRFNAVSLGNPVVRHQVWTAMSAADLDDRIHVTTRHLVTRLAAAVSGGRRCPDIRAAVAANERFPLSAYLYSSIYTTVHASGGDTDAMDRVMSSYDPTDRGSPRRDRRLAFHLSSGPTEDLAADLTGPDYGTVRDHVEQIASQSIDDAAVGDVPEYRQQVLSLNRHMSRRLSLLNPEHALSPGPAVKTQAEFTRAVTGVADRDYVRDLLVTALNGTLGIDAQRHWDLLVPRDYAEGLRGTGFAALIPRNLFRVVSGDGFGRPYSESPFLESWPRTILLEAVDSDDSRVSTVAIPLLMFEVLARAKHGFRPTSQTERSYLVRLNRFYRDLGEHRWVDTPRYALFENGRVRARATLAPSHIAFAEV